MYSTINKGDMVYYARIQKKNGTYDLCELKVRTVGEDYFCGMDKKDRHVYLFGYNALGDYVFQTRKEACPKQNTCKRYTHKKGVPASEDASAKLYNICNDKYGYKLFLEDEDIKEDEKNDNNKEI